uniref:Uncharacterized protein n=1 Tax=Timema monikensis TaxID=170555 RepID=A0A7R9HQR5_9NEOP|nr:unnamed protein product [Timema monikensis]
MTERQAIIKLCRYRIVSFSARLVELRSIIGSLSYRDRIAKKLSGHISFNPPVRIEGYDAVENEKIILTFKTNKKNLGGRMVQCITLAEDWTAKDGEIEEGKLNLEEPSLFSTPDRDSNLDFPIFGSLVYCGSSALDNAAIEKEEEWQHPHPMDETACQSSEEHIHIVARHKKVCMSQHLQLTDEIACQSPEEHIHIVARHKKGCLKELEQWIKQESLVLVATGTGIAAYQILGMVFSICLCRDVTTDI